MMVGRPRAELQPTLTPPPPCTTSPLGGKPQEKFDLRPGQAFLLGGEPLANFVLLGRMDTDQGRAPLRRVKHSNQSPHDIPPMELPLVFFFRVRGTNSPIRGKPLANFELPGRMYTDQGRKNLGKGGHWRR